MKGSIQVNKEKSTGQNLEETGPSLCVFSLMVLYGTCLIPSATMYDSMNGVFQPGRLT